MSVTLHFQSTGIVPGNAEPFRMLGNSLTVGRSDQNDLVLPDPDKMISGRHCAIEDQDGNVVVIDLSTNGTFLNYGKSALGNTPTPLNDGDILSIGPYELLVEIPVLRAADPAAGLADPALDDQVSDGDAAKAGSVTDILDDVSGGADFLDDLLGGPVAGGPSDVVREQLGDDGLMPPLGEDDDGLMDPVPEDAGGPAHSSHSPATSDVMPTPAPATSAIPDDWDLDSDLPEDALDVPFDEPAGPDPLSADHKKDDPPKAAQAPQPEPDISSPPEAASMPVKSTPGSNAAAHAFLRTLGGGELSVADEELEVTMARMGHVMRAMIHGVREILMTRASIKSEFRINQTMISAGGNNPLKFSVSPEQAVESIVKPSKGYLDSTEVAEQALGDIKAHEVAMMTGMEAALKGVLAKLEPAALAKVIEADASFRSVLSNKKARYWDSFEQKYQEISDQAENDFHDLFSKEFARAYQDQVERLK